MAKRLDIKDLNVYYSAFHAVKDVTLEVPPRSITAFIGIFAVSASLEGYLYTHMSWYQRLICCAGGLMLIFPGTVTDVGGILLVGIVFAMQYLGGKKPGTVKA